MFFCFNLIRTLVTMATYSNNSDLQWETWKLAIFAVSLQIFRFFFTEMFLE